MPLRCVACTLAVLAIVPLLPAQQSPAIGGFVTQPGTTAYQVNGTDVLCNPARTQEVIQFKHATRLERSCPARILGESITIYGDKRKKPPEVAATRVETDPPVDLAVDGFALVDRVLAPLTNGIAILRADGYPLTLTPATKVTFAPASGLTLASLGTNVWVRYTGTLHPDGTVIAASLQFSPNQVNGREDKLRTKTEFDAAAIGEEDRQSTASRLLLGRKAKQIPASHNDPVQQRLNTVGARVTPVFQQQLPASDPTKINFRFQLVDDPKLHDVITEPSGIIQVPESIPTALADDAQLAAVLAAAVTEVMEKQSLRAIPGNQARTAAGIAGAAAGLFVPGLGTATSIVNWKTASVAERHRQEQAVRTALSFMQDAGYPLAAAPLAWWTLAKPANKTLPETRLPDPTQYTYTLLGTLYRTAPATPLP